MGYAILLFLLLFVQTSVIGIPFGLFVFIFCEALRVDHRMCVLAGTLTGIALTTHITISVMRDFK